MEQFKQWLVSFAMDAGIRIVGALLLLVVGWLIIKRISRYLNGEKAFHRIDKTAKRFLSTTLIILLKALVIITVVSILGVPMSTLAALIATAGLAVGLALQGSLANIAGSFIIICTHLYRIGDYISVNGCEGNVNDINLFHTIISTADNKRVVIPNSLISNASLTDYSALPTRRVDIKCSVAYETDIDCVKKALLSCAMQNELVLSDPAPVVYLTECADSSIDFTLRVWCKTEDYWTVHFALTESTKRALDENGITVPFPQLDVHLDR